MAVALPFGVLVAAFLIGLFREAFLLYRDEFERRSRAEADSARGAQRIVELESSVATLQQEVGRWQAEQSQRDKYHAEAVAELNSQLGTMREAAATHAAKPASVHDVRDVLANFSREAYRILHSNGGKGECDPWYERAKAFVQLALRPRYAEEFVGRWEDRYNPDPSIQARQRAAACMDWLNGWDETLAEQHVNPDLTASKLAEYQKARSV